VNADAALAQAGSAAAGQQLSDADTAATRAGVTGTPTLTVQRGHGPEHKLDADPLDAAAVATALDRTASR
jgi:protein-disulfide isomerase